jgi:hypothetical protein
VNTSAQRRARTHGLIALAAAALIVPLGATSAVAAPASAAVTNLDHLDFLLDEATPPADVEGHSTYRQDEEPTLVLPWTYADARDGGTFERVGGGPLDPETGYWGQGAYNADDVTRAAVVYTRHWELTGDDDSREKAYELLRSVAYFQTTEGPDAGNVVLWMQPDGTLNPSAEPVELPDPSDSGESYWLARTLWALGEGYAAFKDEDPEFASFLDEKTVRRRIPLQADGRTAGTPTSFCPMSFGHRSSSRSCPCLLWRYCSSWRKKPATRMSAGSPTTAWTTGTA